MAKGKGKNKAPRRKGASQQDAISTFAPAALALFGAGVAAKVQTETDPAKAKASKLPVVLAIVSVLAFRKPQYRKWSGTIAVAAAVAEKRRRALAGQLLAVVSGNNLIVADGAVAQK